MHAAFDNTEAWSSMYQRNNKRTGLKNVRCFPYCSDQHIEKGFCGRPVILRVARQTRESSAPIYSWGEFRRIDDPRDVDVGTLLTADEIRSKTKDPKSAKSDTLNAPYFEGVVDGGEKFRMSTLVRFVFNQRKKGWNYAWQASKHTAKARHAFFAYLFTQEGEDMFRCVGVYISPTFILYCRKRKPDASNEQMDSGSTKRKRDDNLLFGENDFVVMDNDEEDGEEDDFEDDFIINKKKKPVKNNRKQQKIASILAGNASNNVGAQEYAKLKIDPISRYQNSTSSSSFSNFASLGGLTPITQMFLNSLSNDTPKETFRGSTGSTPSSFSGDDSDGIDYDQANEVDSTTKWRVGAVLDRIHHQLTQDGTAAQLNLPQFALDWFLNDLDLAAEELDHQIGSFTSSSSSNSNNDNNNNNQGTLSATNSLSNLFIEPLESTEILNQLANYLLEESSVTASIRQVIAQTQEGKFAGSSDARVKALVNVFQKELSTFLAKRGYTERELDEALRSSSSEPNEDSTKTFTILDQTVTQIVEAEERKSEKKPFTWYHALSVNPEIDLTGLWRIDDNLASAFDECRAKRGVPYMMRRLLASMEAKVVITHTVESVVIGLKSKLFASKEVEYLVDGVERTLDVSPPVPWPSKSIETYRAWFEDTTLRYQHIYNGIQRTDRSVKKNASGDRLEFDIYFQERVADSWQTIFSRKGYALRIASVD